MHLENSSSAYSLKTNIYEEVWFYVIFLQEYGPTCWYHQFIDFGCAEKCNGSAFFDAVQCFHLLYIATRNTLNLIYIRLAFMLFNFLQFLILTSFIWCVISQYVADTWENDPKACNPFEGKINEVRKQLN